jgi:hypothetical protein
MGRCRRLSIWFSLVSIIPALSCASSNSATTKSPISNSNSPAKTEVAAINKVPVIHVFVALADNVNQGIVPVSAALGDGENPKTNLYWGAAFGVKTFFSKSRDWQLLQSISNPTGPVLERCVFKHRSKDLYLVADAYRGKEIAKATNDFFKAAAGHPGEKLTAANTEFNTHGSAELIAYVGHDGLMDFKLSSTSQQRDKRERQTIILACASKQYFSQPLNSTGATPLLWTTNLMAPEAYVLSAAIDGWIARESGEQIRSRAARAYDKYQHCGLKSAHGLFATGW